MTSDVARNDDVRRDVISWCQRHGEILWDESFERLQVISSTDHTQRGLRDSYTGQLPEGWQHINLVAAYHGETTIIDYFAQYHRNVAWLDTNWGL